MNAYDLAIIGAGAGGMNAAYAGLALGKKVLLIEKHKPGGECTWSGCIPSKALINIADEIHTAKKYGDISINSRVILKKVRSLIETAHQVETVDVFRNAGVDVMEGVATFKDNQTLDVNGQEIKAKKIIVSTGTSPLVPAINGLEHIEFLTNNNVFLQEELPESLIILGAGAIGVELAQAFSRLGVKIKLIEMEDRILPREDRELSSQLEDILIQEQIDIFTSSRVIEVKKGSGGVHACLEQKDGIKEVSGEKILLALGRKPNTKDLGLEKAGVDFNEKGLIVDQYLETSAPGIYAVGDVAGPYQFSHMAGFQARLAVNNAFNQNREAVDYKNVAWTTFTHPELARSGLTENEAKLAHGDSISVSRFVFSDLDRAVVDEKTQGMVKVVCDEQGYILGASILGERGSELLGELQVMKTFNHKLADLAQVIHPYPSYSEAFSELIG